MGRYILSSTSPRRRALSKVDLAIDDLAGPWAARRRCQRGAGTPGRTPRHPLTTRIGDYDRALAFEATPCTSNSRTDAT